MKKIFLIFSIIFCLLCCGISANAQSFSDSGVSNAYLEIDPERASYNPDEKIPGCWECSLVEGVYTYTFNFVFKMYKVLAPRVFQIVLVFLLFWFIWLVWSQVIQKQEGDVFSLLKTVFIKIFAITFVGAMLTVAPHELFSYTIDPVMNLGTGFAKWILVETRNENEILQNKKLKNFDCANIKLSRNTLEMFRDNSVDTEDETNTETLKNLICLTREYSNTYNAGLSLGLKVAGKGFIGAVEKWAWAKGMGVVDIGAKFLNLIPGWGKIAEIIVTILAFIAKIGFYIEMFEFILLIVAGLGIGIAFLYVAFTFICLIVDIVIRLALIGTMMPIAIGAWAFNDNGYVNLRSKLSQRLFGGVLKCACRLTFLAISISISTFLLTELITTKFDMPNNIFSIQDLYRDDLHFSSGDLLKIFFNPGLLVAILLTTLITWSLLTESISMADKICGSLPLYNGVGDDKIFNGLKQITISTLKTITQVPVRTVVGYRKYAATKKDLRDKVAEDVRASTIKKWEKEVFEEGKLDHLYDLPADIIIDRYEAQQELLSQPEDFYNVENTPAPRPDLPHAPTSGPIPTNPHPTGVFSPEYIQMQRYTEFNDREIERTIKPQQDFINDKFKNIDEYENLSQEKKNKLVSVLFETGPKSDANITEISNDTEIAKLVNVIQPKSDELFPMTSKNTDENYQTPLHQMKDEYIKEEVLNLIAKDVTSNNKVTYNKKDLEDFVKNGTNKKDTNMQRYYYIFADRVKTDLSKKKKKLDNLIISNKRIKSTKVILNAQHVVLSIKNEELHELQEDLEGLKFTDNPMKRNDLRRRLKKLQEEIDDLMEKSPYEIEDEYASIIDNYRNNKKRRRSKINPNKQV